MKSRAIITSLLGTFWGTCGLCSASLLSNQSAQPGLLAINPRLISQSGVLAPTGAVWSELSSESPQNLFANSIAGVGFSATSLGSMTSRVADDFQVSDGHFLLTGVVTCAYRFGSNIPNPLILDGTAKIVDQHPSLNSDPISTANLAEFSSELPVDLGSGTVTVRVYRIFHSDHPLPGNNPNLSRQLWQIKYAFQSPVNLGTGNYWLIFQANTELPQLASSAFIPTTTHAGTRSPLAPGNALNQSGLVWTPIVDSGFPIEAPDIPQELPFILEGARQKWPDTFSVASGALFAGALTDLYESDENYVFVLCDESDPIGMLRFETTANLESIAQISVSVECSSTRNDQTLFLQAWNRDLTQWETVMTGGVGLSDSTISGTLVGTASYLGPSNLVQARAQIIPSTDLIAVDGWSNRFDFAAVTYHP